MANTKLEEALRGFVNAIGDLTSLEVTTYTGDVTLEFREEGSGAAKKKTGELDWDKLLANLGGPDGKLELVAATKIMADFDTVNFRTNKVQPGIEALIDLHDRTVRNAREGRQAIVKMLIDSLGLLKP